MSRKTLLNITSKKKRDDMLSYNGTATAPTLQPSNVLGAYLYSPSMRTKELPGIPEDPNSNARRSSEYTFARGYAERIQLTVSNGNPWQWRRIMVFNKDLDFYPDFTRWSRETTTQGFMRLLTNSSGTATYNQTAALLFEGAFGLDWNDPMIAPIDTKRVKVYSDRLMTINPGSTDGKSMLIKRWYPINKSIVYDDQQQGKSETPALNSTVGRPGAGDFLIIDLFASSGAGTSQIQVQMQGTYYWHER